MKNGTSTIVSLDEPSTVNEHSHNKCNEMDDNIDTNDYNNKMYKLNTSTNPQ